MNHFYSATTILELLNLQDIQSAENVISELNKEIHKLGCWTVNDRVPAGYFHEKYPGIEIQSPETPKIFVSKDTQQEIFEFFMRTSAPRLAKKKRELESQKGD